MTDFSGFGLPIALVQELARMQYTTPTPIQEKAIPLAISGRDILGSAQTGTGKTAAFAIPLIAKLMSNPRGSALVLTPTRELAVQVMDVIRKMIHNSMSKSNTALIIGGESMGRQTMELKGRPRIIVGTPGRINDHLERGSLMLHDTGFLVLDETDRMLDMGFMPQLERIAKYLPKVRQTLMFSATLPSNIVKLSEKFLNNPERIAVGAANSPIANIKQSVIHVGENNKYELLLKELESRQGSVIIFVKTKRGADKLSKKLNKDNHSADAIHGDLQQGKRKRVIDAFRAKQHRIMVATDVASRGLDIPHIEHVINYDLPSCPEDYIHRIGRTARAGAEGSSICLISGEDAKKWRDICRLINPGQKLSDEGSEFRGNNNGNRNNNSKRKRHRPFRKNRNGGRDRALAAA